MAEEPLPFKDIDFNSEIAAYFKAHPQEQHFQLEKFTEFLKRKESTRVPQKPYDRKKTTPTKAVAQQAEIVTTETADLWKGINNDNIDLIKSALERKAEVNKFVNETTPLLAIITSSHSAETGDMVDLLLYHKADPKISTAFGGPLQKAIVWGDISIVSKLLIAKADPNERWQNNMSSALRAAVVSEYSSIIELLLLTKADPSHIYADGYTDLMAAVNKDNLDIVKLLVDAGADIGKQDSLGNNALSLALIQGKSHIVEYFREKLCPPKVEPLVSQPPAEEKLATPKTQRNPRRKKPRLAKSGQTFPGAKTRPPVVKTERAIPAPPPAQNLDAHKNPPLLAAIFKKDSATAQKLLDEGADLQLQNASGQTALSIAAFVGDKAIVERLIVDMRGELNHPDQLGNTPLMLAAKKGHVEVVKVLLAADADIRPVNKKGESIESWATGPIQSALRAHKRKIESKQQAMARSGELLESRSFDLEKPPAIVSKASSTKQPPKVISAPIVEPKPSAAAVKPQAAIAQPTLTQTKPVTAIDQPVPRNQPPVLTPKAPPVQPTSTPPPQTRPDAVSVQEKPPSASILDSKQSPPLTSAKLPEKSPSAAPQTPGFATAPKPSASLPTVSTVAKKTDGSILDQKHSSPLISVPPKPDLKQFSFRYAKQDDELEFLKGVKENQSDFVISELQKHSDYVFLKDASGQSLLTLTIMQKKSVITKQVLTYYPQTNKQPHPAIDHQNNNGESALMLAAVDGVVENLDLLLKQGANCALKDNQGNTALIYAVRSGVLEAVEALLKPTSKGRALEVNVANNFGETPLMWAAFNGNAAIVAALIQANANIHQVASSAQTDPSGRKQNFTGYAALELAGQRNHTEVIELLKAAILPAVRLPRSRLPSVSNHSASFYYRRSSSAPASATQIQAQHEGPGTK